MLHLISVLVETSFVNELRKGTDPAIAVAASAKTGSRCSNSILEIGEDFIFMKRML